ncbi:hypothetical protein LguiB_033666 [Lonicera macranthoides]
MPLPLCLVTCVYIEILALMLVRCQRTVPLYTVKLSEKGQLLTAFGQAIEAQRGATLFNRACIGCHVAGGNIIQPGATLFFKDLERNGVDTEDEIYRITYYGKGRMPGFGQNCTPRGQCTFGARLQEDEIKVLAEFVKSQADQGWPNVENYGD